jgi:hypothetical protein
MENFYNWMMVPVPKDEVDIWFSVHNMIPEKIELYGDIFESLTTLILETYLGEETNETKIRMSDDDITNHFDWCWKKTIDWFEKENILLDSDGEHKDYVKTFFLDSFYYQKDSEIRSAVKIFVKDLFDIDKVFVKSDLDIITEIYKVFNRTVIHL